MTVRLIQFLALYQVSMADKNLTDVKESKVGVNLIEFPQL